MLISKHPLDDVLLLHNLNFIMILTFKLYKWLFESGIKLELNLGALVDQFQNTKGSSCHRELYDSVTKTQALVVSTWSWVAAGWVLSCGTWRRGLFWGNSVGKWEHMN
ncbi:hypothetical protein D4L85_29385 [Chryseolinea soli]|uniref:Uncharacterized protein n=1 Tax=Chryseolinea soli TaxID=2321403 RepID=A0A385STA7_9BACT|nr:hypothetical protein D4L85_29385 [Chryseolinea soli]